MTRSEENRKILPHPQDYAQRHSRAFREAFNFLNAHFPPQDTDLWWKQTAADAAEAGLKNVDNPLFTELIAALLDYMADESELRRA